MPRRVQGPGGTVHEFPDDATDTEISAALEAIPEANAKMMPPAARSRTWTDTAVESLPAIGGAVGGIVGGVGGTAFGMGFGGVPGAVGGAALGGGAGEAAQQLIQRVRGRGGPSSPTEAATDIASQGAVQAGAEAIGGAAGRAMKPMGERLMQSALKPGWQALKKQPGGVPPAVTAMLEQGINVTKGGYAKLEKLLSATQDEIKDAVSSIPTSINPFKVTSRLGPLAAKEATDIAPQQGLEDISRIGQQFLEAHGGAPISPVGAQEMKIKGYQKIRKSYGQMGSAEVEARKAILRGLKEELATEAEKAGRPISALNIKEGGLIEAADQLGRRVGYAANRDIGGLATLAIQRPVTFLSMLMDRSPAVKSMLARGLYSSAGTAARVNPQLIRAAVQAVAETPDEEGQ